MPDRTRNVLIGKNGQRFAQFIPIGKLEIWSLSYLSYLSYTVFNGRPKMRS
jgi:hypothetical protein